MLLGCFQDRVYIYKEHLLIVLSSSIKTFSTSGSSVLMMPLTATEGQGELGKVYRIFFNIHPKLLFRFPEYVCSSSFEANVSVLLVK